MCVVARLIRGQALACPPAIFAITAICTIFSLTYQALTEAAQILLYPPVFY
jgi:hypothetical protein